ncbi:hypothetical protein DKX38_014033 [Salix brachista]|uniref:Uncharacterized protein n=1 Tax=Salix brachista TaxID=2182728 RepID=A0A5N5LE66_9ROSI|nr:hypothetical protein DKX38_014033 [Salix brachista]
MDYDPRDRVVDFRVVKSSIHQELRCSTALRSLIFFLRWVSRTLDPGPGSWVEAGKDNTNAYGAKSSVLNMEQPSAMPFFSLRMEASVFHFKMPTMATKSYGNMRNPSSESLSAHVYMTRILEQMPLFGILHVRSLKTVIMQIKLLLKSRSIPQHPRLLQNYSF